MVGLKADAEPITPCGRCRQVLNEVAALGATDPLVLCVSKDDVRRMTLSALLPYAFGPSLWVRHLAEYQARSCRE